MTSLLEIVAQEFFPEKSSRVHGVVYLGAGVRIGDTLASADVPAMLVKGSRDPFTPPEVRLVSIRVRSLFVRVFFD